MANTNNPATVWNCPNYTGELYLIGANQTPFLNLIGGLQGGMVRNRFGLRISARPAVGGWKVLPNLQ
jgi:hypothetical protein